MACQSSMSFLPVPRQELGNHFASDSPNFLFLLKAERLLMNFLSKDSKNILALGI
jgi:hypothetical protein